MSASEPTPSVSPAPSAPTFSVHRAFAKSMSLEIPGGAQVFQAQGAPDANIAVQVSSNTLAPGVYEVALRATLTGKLPASEKPLYLVEVEQAGVFEVRGANDAQLADILEIAAPTILGPYLRALLADVLTRATLPVTFLPEINWAAMAADSRATRIGQAADSQYVQA